MKVLSIWEKRRESDNKLYYKVDFEGTHIPLIVWDTPQFSEGDDIPQDELIIIGQGDRKTYSLKTDRRSGRSPEETAAIRAQVAVKILADIFIAGKLNELENSNDYLAISLKEWLKTALIHDPLMAGILEQGKSKKIPTLVKLKND